MRGEWRDALGDGIAACLACEIKIVRHISGEGRGNVYQLIHIRLFLLCPYLGATAWATLRVVLTAAWAV